MTKLTRQWWVFLLLWILPIALSAQSTIPQIKEKLEQASTTTKEKMTLNYQLAELNQRQRPVNAIYNARQAFGFAQELRNNYYQRQSALLLGRLFIRQGDETNARLWLDTALQLGKRHNEGKTVIDAATLLSGLEVRKNNYKRAYELNLAALNFINKNKKSLSQLDKEYGQRKRALEKELRDIQSEIDKLNVSVEDYQKDPSEIFQPEDTSPIINIASDTPDNVVAEDPHLTIDSDSTTGDSTASPVFESIDHQGHSYLFPWLSAILGLLSLALLGALYYFWNKRQQDQEHFEHELLKKERLLRNYREEMEESERLKNQSSFANGNFQKAKRIEALSILIMDIGHGRDFENQPDETSFVSAQQKLWADLNLIIQLYPDIFYLKKIGTTLIFGSGLNTNSHQPDQLIAAARDLREYFDGKEDFTKQPKMAIHTGPAMVSTLDLNRESLDILGHSFDQCSWLVGKANPGQILISEKTQSLLKNKDLLQFHSEQKDWVGAPFRFYELPY